LGIDRLRGEFPLSGSSSYFPLKMEVEDLSTEVQTSRDHSGSFGSVMEKALIGEFYV
jgi:hypothetical protein